MDQNTKPLTDLPSDTLLQIFSQCDVLDILNLSSTCTQLLRVADEHQVWLHQAGRLQIPIPSGTAPSKAELKDWVISRTRVDVCWTKRCPGNLVVHSYGTDDNFVDAHFIPGGEFVVFLYGVGDIGLNRIEKSEATGELVLREVARYEELDENYPGAWSGLLTETSYGCPVLIWVDNSTWNDPYVFLIDPVSQVIEKKQRIRCDFSSRLRRILAVKDRMFFICGVQAGYYQIVLVAEPGPNQVVKRFNLDTPVGDNVRFFLVSENGLIVSNHIGIRLYHIPEPGAAGNDSDLVPVWSWQGRSTEYRGTLYETASPYPALWLQGVRVTHTLEFDVDESGCFPVVVDHHFTRGPPAYCVWDRLKLQGRKGVSFGVRQGGEIVFNTGILGKPGITRQLRAHLPCNRVDMWSGLELLEDEVRCTDLDEVTGRIMIMVGPMTPYQTGEWSIYSRQLFLADLPI